ncbi:unnamed protein product [Ceutorhynchus assimilis]|uniref:non-specific serine/threonine protein kinase n=1 Tax=Ceutorhynchus assimilis TaxID=467358 RepID=A0A9N9M9E4_9CUCU|nr:unnamed protein product [Ceutorhynchus assimilis]
MDPDIEIRKLPPSVVREFSSILDYDDSWKRLMAIIPKQLSKNGYNSDISADNLAKYNSEHFKIVELGGIRLNRSCTEILFDEWGTSGRPRATIGHVKYLLTKAQLFRAADYASKLLGEDPPPRPASGPAATIKINSSELAASIDVERHLDEINYPQVAIQQIRNKESEIKNLVSVIPAIFVSEVKTTAETVQIPLVVPKEKPHTSEEETANVDSLASVLVPDIPNLLQGSSESQIEPASTHLMTTNSNSNNEDFIPAISQMLKQESADISSTTNTEESIEASDTSSYTIDSDIILGSTAMNSNKMNTNSDLIPKFDSDIVPKMYSDSIPNLDSELIPKLDSELIPTLDSELIPKLDSELIPTLDSELIPKLDSELLPTLDSNLISKSHSDLIPNFEMLQLSNENDHSNISLTGSSSDASSSVLPSISLNTQLPHFDYSKLEDATNRFSSDKENGRFLGAGAFGSVFLATDLLDKPVAVKKIFLDHEKLSNEIEQITEQFRNEVELLCKYKHDNLVSLLGYSCDGPTYCLVYEYVSGGSLFDVLQNNPQKILWKSRIQISLGTARAIAYLHTAFSTPLVHRDIKSANILLDDNNNAKLGDFGIVKLLPSQNTELESTPCGTSAYMPPEYHNGEISVKLDTFSFAVVLLELLTSLPPLDYHRPGGDLVTYVEDHCEDSIDALLDTKIGTWRENRINFAQELYYLTLECLKEKMSRLPMVDVLRLLECIHDKLGK